jgi:peptidoglycan hydrolase-like protein with peptidoglycan-binding domain
MHPVLRYHDGYDATSPDLRDEVKALQALLLARGFPVEVDGFFGNGTQAAVEDFQRAHGLEDDGIVGPRTWAALAGDPPPDSGAMVFQTTYAPNSAQLRAQLAAAEHYRAAAAAAAARYGLPLCVIGGVGSRESAWGLALVPEGPGGTGDLIARRPKPPMRPGRLPPNGGFGRGLMQIDFDAHEFARSGNWKDPAANLLYGAGVLSQSQAFLERRLQLRGTELLHAALAAYNCGPGNVLKALQTGRDVDYFTAGRNYGKDTLNRAGWFRLKGWL